MQYILSILLALNAVVQAQNDGDQIIRTNEEFRTKLNAEYADSTESPLPRSERLVFEGLPFFPIDTNYHVVATFRKAKRAKPFEMKTTTNRRPIYELYGTAKFMLNGKEFTLNLYQSHQLREMEEYRDYLFLPFTDMSNGEESYGGGRFIDLKIPEGQTIVIDFNQCYNPYCAYNSKYSCPIPPKENFLDTKVLAGVMSPH